MKLINLTPHPIHLHLTQDRPDQVERILTIPPEPEPARVEEQFIVDAEFVQLESDGNGNIKPIGVFHAGTMTYGDAISLPKESEGIAYIVSAMVRDACPHRRDVFSPTRFVRDASGRIIGCRAFARNKPA